VFVAQGYHAAAMDDIAERAGVSKPVLYQHFPGKLDLYLALLDQHCEHLLVNVRAALDSTTDNKLRVAATIAAYFDYVEHDSGAFRLVFESDLTNEAAVRERTHRVTSECAEAIKDVIASDTGLSDEESMLLAVGLTGVAHVTARYWLSTEGSIPRDAAARIVSQLAWRASGTSPGSDFVVPRRILARESPSAANPYEHKQRITVEIKIGIQHTARELSIESNQTAEEVQALVATALGEALAGKAAVLTLEDDKGRKVLVAADKIAYIEIGEPTGRRVGFGAI